MLELGFRVVPVLVHYEVLEAREEGDLAEDLAEFEALVDVEGADEGLEEIGTVFGFQFGFWVVVDGVVCHS